MLLGPLPSPQACLVRAGRFVVKAFNVPVTVGELRVEPGDLIMADSGGVVRIPLDIADKVVERAENIRGKEDVIFKWFRSDDFKASTTTVLVAVAVAVAVVTKTQAARVRMARVFAFRYRRAPVYTLGGRCPSTG